MTERILFIVNPNSGNGKGEKLHRKLQLLLGKAPAGSEIRLTEGIGHAVKLVEAHCDHFARIIVVGGDGTLNEALNGLKEESQAVLGIIPAGSGNDFARTVGMTGRFERDFISVINGSRIILSDYGEVEYKVCGTEETLIRRFMNSAGIGFDAVVSDYKNNSRFLKGLPQYIVAVLKSLFNFRPFQMTSHFDDLQHSGRKLLIAVSNGKTYGGGFRINPEAEITDNFLNACVIETMPVYRIIRDLPKLITGKHVTMDSVHMAKFKSANITPSEPVHLHADGEVITSEAVNIRFRIRPGQVRFITNY